MDSERTGENAYVSSSSDVEMADVVTAWVEGGGDNSTQVSLCLEHL